MLIEGFEISKKMLQDWKREEGKAYKIERMKQKGTWKNNPDYNKEVGVIKRIDPVVKIRGKKKIIRINGRKVEKIIGGVPVKYSELTQEEQKEYRENIEREERAREERVREVEK